MPVFDASTVGPYPTALAAAVTTGVLLSGRARRQLGVAALPWYGSMIGVAVVGFLGSTLIIPDWAPISAGEKSIVGALIVGIAAFFLVARLLDRPPLRVLDAVTIPTLAAMAIGRIGCFFAGCCSGIATNVPWAVTHPRSGAHVHPVQLYEMAGDLVLIGILRLRGKPSADGERVRFGVLGYLLLRFSCEFFRAGRESVAGLNPVQWTLLAIAVAVALMPMFRSAPRVAFAAVSPLGALFLLQDSSAAPTGTDLILSGAVRNGSYTEVIGRELLSDCDGGTNMWPTFAHRATRVSEGRLGLRRQFASGSALSIESRYLSGSDLLRSIDTGVTTKTPVPHVGIRGVGGSVEYQNRSLTLRTTVIAGQLSRRSAESAAPTTSVLMRTRDFGRWYVEAQVAERATFATTGEFSYIGAGYTFGPRRPRLFLGAGEGAAVSMQVPIRRLTLEFMLRDLSTRDDGSGGGSIWSVGARQAIRLGR